MTEIGGEEEVEYPDDGTQEYPDDCEQEVDESAEIDHTVDAEADALMEADAELEEEVAGDEAEPVLPEEPVVQKTSNRVKQCVVCGVTKGLRPCQGCKDVIGFSPVLYCGQECQRDDWSEHKVVCKWRKQQKEVAEAATKAARKRQLPLEDADVVERAPKARIVASETETFEEAVQVDEEVQDVSTPEPVSMKGKGKGKSKGKESVDEGKGSFSDTGCFICGKEGHFAGKCPDGKGKGKGKKGKDKKGELKAAAGKIAEEQAKFEIDGLTLRPTTVQEKVDQMKELLGIDLDSNAVDVLKSVKVDDAMALLEEVCDRQPESTSKYVVDALCRNSKLCSPALFKLRFAEALRQENAMDDARKASKGKGKKGKDGKDKKGKGKDDGKGTKGKDDGKGKKGKDKK